MRIQGGSSSGRNIKAPSAKDIRPTAQMVKEAIFDILASKIDGAYFLDIFAGFGTMGLEAASRGAAKTVFADKNRYAVSIIKENISKLGLNDKCSVITADAKKAIETRLEGPFSIIFADPPYAFSEYGTITKAIFDRNLLAEDGIFIMEHYHKTIIDPAGFEIFRTKKYGQTSLTFMRVKKEE
ncbi:MAG: 16S rRNA (guanine(966)-N(2))-methyltransferase RsmD [bacterium]|nr:16S rRNA (guanine(966)-N(2))-methyltransferase RsmD [bacterium]